MKELKNFFNPETIAVVGASEHPEKVGYILMDKLSNFKGQVIPINPKHNKVFGKKCYGSLRDYSGRIDLTVIAIPSKFVKAVFEDCGKKKIRNVIVISAGFSEVGNRKLEEELLDVAKRYGINLLGPNCFGIANPYLDLDTTFANTSAKKGDIAFISQSGALWSYLSDISFSENSLGFSGFVSLGNMADLDFSDFVKYFDKDEKTKKIILYIERLKNGREFIEVCKNSKKEILVVKSGKTKEGTEATVSHTGSLATDFEIYKGAFKQAKIKLVDSLASVFGFDKIDIKDLDKKKNVVIITNAGGAGALITDYLVKKGFEVEPPLDIIGTALADDYRKTLNKFKEKNYNFIVIFTPQKMSEPEKTAEAIVEFSKHQRVTAIFLGANSIKRAETMLKDNKIDCITEI